MISSSNLEVIFPAIRTSITVSPETFGELCDFCEKHHRRSGWFGALGVSPWCHQVGWESDVKWNMFFFFPTCFFNEDPGTTCFFAMVKMCSMNFGCSCVEKKSGSLFFFQHLVGSVFLNQDHYAGSENVSLSIIIPCCHPLADAVSCCYCRFICQALPGRSLNLYEP